MTNQNYWKVDISKLNKKSNHIKEFPESERLIRCYGFDWSPFVLTGKFVDFKDKQKGNKPQSRLMVQDKYGFWVSEKEKWKCHIEYWEYI